MKKLTIILSLLIISVSCGKQAFKADNELYPGFWVGEDTSHFYELDIPSSNTEGTWNQKEKNPSGSVSRGKYTAKIFIKGNTMKIGFKKFKIDQEPALDTLGISMVLDGIRYYRN
jgi:hypothetical protein